MDMQKMDMQKIMKDAENMQKSLSQAQEELERMEIKGSSSGDLVEIWMNGQGELKNIKIKSDVVNPNDVETLEDLILSAFKDAHNKAISISKDTISKYTMGLGLGPM